MSFRTLVLTFCLIAAWPLHAENNAVEAMSQARASTDARSRAKIHTELGSLYFQDGNMAVALEESRIALLADSSYAPAHTLRALVHAYLRETEQAESDFRRPRIRKSTTTMAGSSARTARKSRGFPISSRP
jgi:type IV pilus assembly protein PilF